MRQADPVDAPLMQAVVPEVVTVLRAAPRRPIGAAWRALLACLCATMGSTSIASAQSHSGFTIERYEPTPAGESTFAVDHPWYTQTRAFAAADLTLDYGHDPLVFGYSDQHGFHQTNAVIAHQLVGHLDLAASFLGRVLVAASLPVVLLERGTAEAGVSPLSGAAVGDLRLGAMVRLWRQPLHDGVSLHAGVDLWIPFGVTDHHSGDSNVRVLPKLVAAGYRNRISWSATAGFLYRPTATIGTLASSPGDTVGSEVHLGAAIAYSDRARRFSVGPEAALATVVTDGHGFKQDFTSLELLAGGTYNIVRQVDVGLALGLGVLREPGTPDFRLITRIAYAPWRADLPPRPKPVEVVLPPADRDRDGISDVNDVCPDEAKGAHPDLDRVGCPERDSDGDAVLDDVDVCPTVVAGAHPDRLRAGCPDEDSDDDGRFDSQDACPDQPSGLHPDLARPGCPLPDRDADEVTDDVDACPDEPGAPDTDPKKNGCAGLVRIKDGQIVLSRPVLFEAGKDVLLPSSLDVLRAIATALAAQPAIERLSIEGHTDSRGDATRNLELSERRAKSVMAWLVEHGVAAARLEAHGFGSSRPITNNETEAGRAANQRVELRIVGAEVKP